MLKAHKKTASFIGFNPLLFTKHACLLSGLFLVLSCAQIQKNTDLTTSQDITEKKGVVISTPNIRSSAEVNQISSKTLDLQTQQIERSKSESLLTVEQLKSYFDRCDTDISTFKAEVDCSELSLRVKRAFREDDKIIDALITLNRIGRNPLQGRNKDDLTANSPNLSASVQAVASGLAGDTLGETATAPPSVSAQEIEEFLEQSGIGVNSGIISLITE